jgi:hypothetical protein
MYEEPDVGHVVAYTWHWPSPRYHEPIVVGSISIQQILFLCLPRSKHGRTLSGRMELTELRQWGEMVGTPSTLENGCVQWNYGGIYYI